MKSIFVALSIAVLLILGASVVVYLQSEKNRDAMYHSLVGETYREIVNPSGFVNTDGKPIMLSDYIGKNVVLLEFMRYTCVNCQHSFPHLVSWHEAYRSDGLAIIGIHTPDFAFERDQKNVEAAMQKSGITFPIVLDNDYATWNTYDNNFWPHTFIIDTDGTIVYDHIGAGAYEETESVIKKLLTK